MYFQLRLLRATLYEQVLTLRFSMRSELDNAMFNLSETLVSLLVFNWRRLQFNRSIILHTIINHSHILQISFLMIQSHHYLFRVEKWNPWRGLGWWSCITQSGHCLRHSDWSSQNFLQSYWAGWVSRRQTVSGLNIFKQTSPTHLQCPVLCNEDNFVITWY